MIKNKSFSPHVLWLENMMKKSPEQPERIEMFCYWLERDKDFWANYEANLRERFGAEIKKPNRRKLITEYFREFHTKEMLEVCERFFDREKRQAERLRNYSLKRA